MNMDRFLNNVHAWRRLVLRQKGLSLMSELSIPPHNLDDYLKLEALVEAARILFNPDAAKGEIARVPVIMGKPSKGKTAFIRMLTFMKRVLFVKDYRSLERYDNHEVVIADDMTVDFHDGGVRQEFVTNFVDMREDVYIRRLGGDRGKAPVKIPAGVPRIIITNWKGLSK